MPTPFSLWLLSLLRRLRAKFTRNTHVIFVLVSWLLRRFSRGLLRLRPASDTQGLHLFQDHNSSSLNHQEKTKTRPETIYICASAVPRSAQAGSVPDFTITPESPTHPRTSSGTERPNSVAVPGHDSIGPYSSLHAPATRSWQDVSSHSRVVREASAEDNHSIVTNRLSLSHIGPIPAQTGPDTPLSSRAPSRYFGNAAQSIRSRSRSRSPAPYTGPPPASVFGSTLHINQESSRSSSHGFSVHGPSTSSASGSPQPLPPPLPSQPTSVGVVPSLDAPPGSTTALPASTPAPSVASSHSSDVGLSVQSPSGSSLGVPFGYSSMMRGVNQVEVPSTRWMTVDLSQTTFTYPALPANVEIRTVDAEATRRYDRTYLIPTELDEALCIPPLGTHWPHSREVGNGEWEEASCGEWLPATHPEGNLYFYHPTKHIYTDMYLYDDHIRANVEEFAQYLEKCLESSHKTLPSEHCELVLDIIDEDDGTIYWTYYYVDHDTRVLFWLHPYIKPAFVGNVEGKRNPSHIKTALEYQYWFHWALYPFGSREFPPDALDELQGMLLVCGVDQITSASSTAPYHLNDLKTFSSFLKKAQALPNPRSNPHLAWMVSRLTAFFVYWRYIHFHGQRGTRLDREQSVHRKEGRPRTLLISFLSPIFFFAPEVHLIEVEKLWTDEVLNSTTWKPFIDRLLNEWQEFVLFGTVLLNANVAFLEIPYVGETPIAGASQLISYLSIVASVGTIVIGLMLIRQNRKSAQREVPEEVAAHLGQMKSQRFGMEPLALLYSAPYALLMWAMLTFVVAFITVCFDDSNSLTRLLVGTTFLAVLGLIAWCLLYGLSIITDTWFYGSLKLFTTWRAITAKKKRDLVERWDDRPNIWSFFRGELRRRFHHPVGNGQPVAVPNSDISIHTSTV